MNFKNDESFLCNGEAVKQVISFNKYLYDPAANLYFHCWCQDIEQNGVAHWLRCNGWVAMAQVELLGGTEMLKVKKNYN